jgi:hypothetical protein
MSYAPSTKLSYNRAEECATVLTGGMVMITKGLGRGTMIKLEDWLILAEGDQQEEYIPLPKVAEPLPKEEPKAEPKAAEPLPKAAESFLEVGTKMTWTLGPETYRIAVQTAKGILQVKSVTDGGGEIDRFGPLAQYGHYPLLKTPFASYTDWLKSLPPGGKMTITTPKTALQKRAVVPVGLTDIQKLEALQRNFKVRAQIYESPSPNATTKMLKENLMRLTEQYLAVKGAAAVDADLVRRLRHIQNIYGRHLKTTEKMPEADRDKINYFYLQRGTSKLLVRCGDTIYRILSHKGMIVRDDSKVFNSLAEMGATALMAHYRRQVILV